MHDLHDLGAAERKADPLVPGRLVVLTGGCGFLGQHLTRELLAGDGCRVRLLDLGRRECCLYDYECDDHVDIRLGRDVSRRESMEGDFDGAHAVVHLAGVISFLQRDRDRLRRVHVEGTANVVEGARRAGVGAFIHVSSVAALGYGDGASTLVDEEFRFDWREAERRRKHYMLSKRDADAVVRERADGMHAVIIYPGLMFGPGDLANAPKFARAYGTGGTRVSAPGGTNVVDVRDVARGIARAVESPPPPGGYLLSGHNVRHLEIGRVFSESLGAAPPERVLPAGLRPVLYGTALLLERLSPRPPQLTADAVDSGFRFRYYTHDKATAVLGWRPEIPLETSVRDTVTWLRENGLVDGAGNGRD
ncbi:MAG: NAD-dependent epimerase/dehydratase family protein [Gemmatimonadota bacterium]